MFELGGAQELEGAFSAAKQQGASAMMALSDPMAANNSDRIVSLSFKYRIPVVSPYMHMAKAGAVLAYGPNRALLYRRAASLVARVVGGGQPRRPAHRAAQSIRHGDQHEVGAKLWFASSRCLARTCNARRTLDQAVV